jgi:ABC-type dipeptide/oligopeptide/nickel transport system permease component
MVMPALTLDCSPGPLTRYLRSSILQTLSQEYVLASGKGLAEQQVIAGHILRNH